MALSIVTIALFIFRVYPNTVVDIGTFIGVCTAFIGIAVTMIIGYQIVNTLQIKQEISDLQITSERLEQMTREHQRKMEIQDYAMQEGFELISAIIKYHHDGTWYSAEVFREFNHALVSSIKSDREEYEWIFAFMKELIDNIDVNNFIKAGGVTIINGEWITNSGETLNDVIDKFNEQVEHDEQLIRQSPKFPSIRMEYNRIMNEYQDNIFQIKSNAHHL